MLGYIFCNSQGGTETIAAKPPYAPLLRIHPLPENDLANCHTLAG